MTNKFLNFKVMKTLFVIFLAVISMQGISCGPTRVDNNVYALMISSKSLLEVTINELLISTDNTELLKHKVISTLTENVLDKFDFTSIPATEYDATKLTGTNCPSSTLVSKFNAYTPVYDIENGTNIAPLVNECLGKITETVTSTDIIEIMFNSDVYFDFDKVDVEVQFDFYVKTVDSIYELHICDTFLKNTFKL
jgi:hypothetical protein